MAGKLVMRRRKEKNKARKMDIPFFLLCQGIISHDDYSSLKWNPYLNEYSTNKSFLRFNKYGILVSKVLKRIFSINEINEKLLILSKSTRLVVIDKDKNFVWKVIDLRTIRYNQYWNEKIALSVLNELGCRNVPQLLDWGVCQEGLYGYLKFPYIKEKRISANESWEQLLQTDIGPLLFSIYKLAGINSVNLSEYVSKAMLDSNGSRKGKYERTIIEVLEMLLNQYGDTVIVESLVHGDLGKGNTIRNNNDTYFIDWGASRRDSVFTDLLHQEIGMYKDSFSDSTYLSGLVALKPALPSDSFGRGWWPYFEKWIKEECTIDITSYFVMVNCLVSLIDTGRTLDRAVEMNSDNKKGRLTIKLRFVRWLVDSWDSGEVKW